jgi:hypothetical protein
VLEDYFLLDGDLPKLWIHSTSQHLCRLIGGGPSGIANNDSSK